ncbi:endo-1,4-beta-xylanase [Fibrisoma montanum]|uniref:Beta-xylanase n=1 Tax=Fibrisoma montanum TaxID=2305895 RepID=A0A418LZJ5_9BACT|nr:endo-1,4-beta-xylanase [Fibrisoma montanum]RIV18655.1 endo-1,4-beta-xylanase [Fibrisoma montanum]
MKFFFFPTGLAAMILLACTMKETANVVQTVPPTTLAEASPFPVGFAINPSPMQNNARYRQTVTQEASSITADLAMKPSRISPQKGVFNFEGADYLVDFARSQKKRVHGHTLVWYINTSPEWLKQLRDSTELETTLREYIQTVGTHFKGKVASWDVVNEAFDNNQGAIRRDSVDKSGRTLFNVGKILGNDYVARMFQYAHKADPGARLFYNDYGQETIPAKLNAIVAMATDFQQRGIPIHGLGLQMHISIDTPDAGIETAIRKLADTGLLIHISELDVAMNPGKKKDFIATPALIEQQYQKYKFVVSTYKKVVPVSQQFGITFWGVDDGTSWIPGHCQCTDYALPFDAQFARKRAYQGFLDGLH